METFPTSPEFIPQDNEMHDFEAQVQLFALMAEPFQEPGLMYHNWNEHIMETFIEAMRWCDKCEQHDTPVDRTKVAFIVLGHDLGYSQYKDNAEVKLKTGLESKEALSAHITEQLLYSMGYEEEYVDDVKVGIMATKLGEPCPTVESKIARLSDIANTYGPYIGFFSKFIKIAREGSAMNGPAAGIANVIEQSCKIVEAYVTTADIRLGPWHNVKDIITAVSQNTQQLRNQGEQFVKEEILKQKVS